MPDPDDADLAEDGGSSTHPSIARQVQFYAFAALVVLAVAFYVGWGVAYGVWLDHGVYAVVATLGLFGLAGMWLSTPSPPVATPASH